MVANKADVYSPPARLRLVSLPVIAEGNIAGADDTLSASAICGTRPKLVLSRVQKTLSLNLQLTCIPSVKKYSTRESKSIPVDSPAVYFAVAGTGGCRLREIVHGRAPYERSVEYPAHVL